MYKVYRKLKESKTKFKNNLSALPIGSNLPEDVIYQYAQEIHRDINDFDPEYDGGDLGKRIEKYKSYILTEIPLKNIYVDEFNYEEDMVDRYIEEYVKNNNYPPVILKSDKKTIIDGTHRLLALRQLGVEKIKAFVGSNKIKESKKPLIGYHITRRSNLKSIYKKGLVCKIPTDYGDNGDEKAVYLFSSLDEAKNALYNWLGERIEEWEEEHEKEYGEICLEIDITGLGSLSLDQNNNVFYEIVVRENIPPERIIKEIEI